MSAIQAKQSLLPFWKDPRYQVAGLLTLITITAAWLRLTNLGTKSLWTDEYWQALFLYTFRFDELLRLTLFREWEPPLIYLLSYPAVKLFGLTEFILRLPSCLAGIATIPIAYLLGKTVAGKRVGIFAALIFCIHPTAYWYSQDARPYALLIFCTALVLWLYVRPVRKTKFSLAFMLGIATLAISHYFAIVPGMFLLAIDLYKQIFRKTQRPWSILFWEYLPYTIISAFLVYLRLLNFNLTPDVYTGTQPIADATNWELIYANLVFGYRRWHLLGWILVGLGAVVLWRRHQELTWHFLLAGTIGTAALMLLCVYIFRFRYFYYLMPQIVLFMAVGLNWLLDKLLRLLRLETVIWKLIGSVFLAGGLIWWSYEPLMTRIHGEKMDYRTLANLYNQELNQSGILLIPEGDFGLTTYPPYSRGAMNYYQIAVKPWRIYAARVAKHMLEHEQGLAVFPTAEQMQNLMDNITTDPSPPRARLYVYGFHVLMWDKRVISNASFLSEIDKLFNSSPMNNTMTKAYFYEDRLEWDDALNYIDQAININPDSSDAHATRGRILRKRGEDAEAAKSERRAWMLDVLLKNSTLNN